MTKPQSAKVAEYARRAAKLPATERESYLDDVCGSDRDLREAVLEAVRQAELREELLRTGGGLDIAARFDRGASEEEPGTQIGPYTLVRRIGTGGFGVVHEARQEEPVKRQVALKVLKAGMDTESVLARFESERQALAVLEHPNIARILDAGATPQGRPYFVMELVKGESITDYCDRQRLSIDERIKLLIPVCRAVQHAHQKGIIHRDLKPSNVLVSEADGEATPVVIDFGIAKINTGELADLTLYTREGELVGTPAFMSPEQISGQDVDTRADVYALGVLLYRLLTGRLPFELDALRKVGLAEIQRILCEDTPPKPSASFAPTLTASAESAQQRQASPESLSRRIRGELDWIVLKALEKDRGRRYDTALGLSADLDRFLQDLPVEAGPPSATYRLRKFAKRNKVPLAFAAAVAATVVFALIQTNLQRLRVEQARADLEQVAKFQADMLQRVDAQSLGLWMRDDLKKRIAEVRAEEGASEEEIAVLLAQFDEVLQRVNFTDSGRAMLDENILTRSLETIDSDYAASSPLALTLLGSVQETYYEIGLYDPARSIGDDLLTRSRSMLGPEHPDTLRAMNNFGSALWALGEHKDAAQYLTAALAARERQLGPLHPDTLTTRYNVGLNYSSQFDREAAVAEYRQVLDGRRQVLGNEHEDTITAMNALGNVLSTVDNDASETLLVEAIETADRVFGPVNSEATIARGNLGAHYYKMGRPDEAMALFSQALDDSRQLFGSDHSQTQVLANNLGILSLYQGKFDEAEALIRDVLESRQRLLGREHPKTLVTTNSLAGVFQQRKDYAAAIALFREALDASRAGLGPDHPDTINTLGNVGWTLLLNNQLKEAEAALLEARNAANRVLTGRIRGMILGKYGRFLLVAKRYDEAEQELLNAYEILTEAVGPEGRQTQLVVPDLIELYKTLGDEEKVKTWEVRRA